MEVVDGGAALHVVAPFLVNLQQERKGSHLHLLKADIY